MSLLALALAWAGRGCRLIVRHAGIVAMLLASLVLWRLVASLSAWVSFPFFWCRGVAYNGPWLLERFALVWIAATRLFVLCTLSGPRGASVRLKTGPSELGCEGRGWAGWRVKRPPRGSLPR
jgi:hypothetical protein